MAVTGVRLYGIVARPERNGAPPAPGTAVVAVRDLGAVVRQAPYAPVEGRDEEIEDYREVVEGAFERGSILPAPFGVVFRSTEQVAHWLQMHYIALTEGMHLVEGRCEARVHVRAREDGMAEADLAALATDVFRGLRRRAIMSVPLRRSGDRLSVSAAFLIERTRWEEFGDALAAQARRCEDALIESTGPWPPYDFVRMDLGV
ncbi:MAG TPA: GvpL/GvpF family gas vesicle protein [Gemmatimonadaceae bacterium]|nr:GvpL/GvpF family gas vesicle protein [Gemmatimonadaceae bacterium]